MKHGCLLMSCIPHPRKHRTLERYQLYDSIRHKRFLQHLLKQFHIVVDPFLWNINFLDLLSHSMPKYVMYFSGIRKHFERNKKYPALNKTYDVQTIALKADWNCSLSEALENCCWVINNISSIQSSMVSLMIASTLPQLKSRYDRLQDEFSNQNQRHNTLRSKKYKKISSSPHE